MRASLVRKLAFFLTALGVIIFGLAASVWAYKFERGLVGLLPASSQASALTSELDIFLGLSVVGIIVVVLGLIFWIQSLLPPEKLD